jgi:hypothetical protein
MASCASRWYPPGPNCRPSSSERRSLSFEKAGIFHRNARFLGKAGWMNQRALQVARHVLPYRAVPVVLIFAFLGLALLRFDLRIEISYQPATVLDIRTLSGQSALNRVVMVRVDGQIRLLRVTDLHIKTVVGHQVCVEKNRFLLRGWTRYGLELPYYCPSLRGQKPSGLSSPAPGLNLGQP